MPACPACHLLCLVTLSLARPLGRTPVCPSTLSSSRQVRRLFRSVTESNLFHINSLCWARGTQILLLSIISSLRSCQTMLPIRCSWPLVERITEIPSQQFHNAPSTLWNDIDGPRSPKPKRFFPYKRNYRLRRSETTSVDKEKPSPSISGCLMKSISLIERLSDVPCPEPHRNNLSLETWLGLKLGQVKVATLPSCPSSPSSHDQFLPLTMMTEDQPSENVPLLMRISSPGDVPVLSNELSLSPSSAKSLTCLMIGRRIPHSLSAKFSCRPNVQTFPQISGSTSLRDRLSTSQKFSGLTIRQRSKPNSPMTLETCSNSPFEFPNSLKLLKLMVTGTSPLEKQSKPLPMPYQHIFQSQFIAKVVQPTCTNCCKSGPHQTSAANQQNWDCCKPIKADQKV